MKRASVALALALLACEGAPSTPGASLPQGKGILRITSGSALDFGAITAPGEGTAEVGLKNDGDGPITAKLEVRGLSAERFTVEGGDTRALEPGEATTVRLTYRGCAPEVAATDACACPERLDSALLHVLPASGEPLTPVALFAEARAAAPRLALDPPARLTVRQSETATVTVRNVGCGRLVLTGADVTAADGAPHDGAEELSLEGCEAWPCALDAAVCVEAEASCPSARTLAVRYTNTDLAQNDQLALRLRSTDPFTPERVLLVDARGDTSGCPPVFTQAAVTTPRPCVGQPVALSATTSTPTRALSWRFVFAPPPVPVVVTSGATTQFIPERSGIYIIEVAPVDECGPAPPAVVTISVSDTCP